LARIVTVFGLEKIPFVKPGDDLSEVLARGLRAERIFLRHGDVLVVSQKIVSKAEGRLVDLSQIEPGQRATRLAKVTKRDARLIDVILRDSKRVLRADRRAIMVETRNGVVCLNAGLDKSNVSGRYGFARLPLHPDKSADALRRSLERQFHKRLSVIVADTYSRPFRIGQVEFAIGVSGMMPLADYRGSTDLYGYRLRYKLVAVADEIAAAAELVMGQGTEAVPAAIVRGLTRIHRSGKANLSRKLLLRGRVDLFRKVR